MASESKRSNEQWLLIRFFVLGGGGGVVLFGFGFGKEQEFEEGLKVEG